MDRWNLVPVSRLWASVLCLLTAGLAPLAVVLATPAPAAAQVLLGARVGVSLSTLAGEGTEDLDDVRSGLLLGVTASYPLSDLLRLETGLSWVQKGAEGELQGFEEPISTDFRLSYLQVPALFRLTPLARHAFRPTVSVGPALSFETACEMDRDESVVAALVGCEDEGRVRTDVGLLFAAGVEWDVGQARLLLEGQYERGLRDLDSTDQLETRHRGFTLAPRVAIPLGPR